MNFIPAGPVERILWAALLILVSGYLAGTWLNRRRSRRIGRWLQGGLEGAGRKPSWKWVKSVASGAQLTIGEPVQPFTELEITYLLLTREIPLLWVIELMRGKRDLLRLRASLRHDPTQEIEVVPFDGEYRRTLDNHAGSEAWHWQQSGPTLGLATRGESNSRPVRSVNAFLEQYGPYVERLSWRQRKPHLVLFMRLTGLERTPPNQLIKHLREMGRSVLSQ
jgi:hypothetical protein